MPANILFESQAKEDIQELERAWSAPETFAFVPDKLPFSLDWISNTLESLPQQLATGHFVLLTSGTTGTPKLIVGERTRAESLARLLDEIQLGAAASQTIVTLPLTYCYAFVNQWLWARVNNRRLILTDGFSDAALLRSTLHSANDAMLCLVGAQVPLLVSLVGTDSFPGIIRLHFAGGQFPQQHLPTIRSYFPSAVIFNNYGCAEAMPRLSIRRETATDVGRNIGKPLPGVEFSTDTGGALLFRSPYSARAFADGEKLTLIDRDEWISTGDIARITDDGSYELHGRASEVFKRHGEKVSLSQLLATVDMSWSGEAALYRERDGNGEDGCVLVLAPQATEIEVRGILRKLREHHPRAQWPLRIEGVDRIPKMPNGKTDTRSLAVLTDKTTYWRQRI